MTLTPLEALLLAAFVSACTAVGVRIWLGNKFVLRSECQMRHDSGALALKNANTKLDILFRMTRALIVHSSIPAAKQEEILNTRADDKE